MSETTMPALYTVLVGDDPERRVATKADDCDWLVWVNGNRVTYRSDRAVHDVVDVIPAGTPVDRIVVLPETNTPRWMSDGRGWTMGGGELFKGPGASAQQARDEADEYLADAADLLAVAHAIATRAAEPTPDPLAQARERLSAALKGRKWSDESQVEVLTDDLTALLAATETDR